MTLTLDSVPYGTFQPRSRSVDGATPYKREHHTSRVTIRQHALHLAGGMALLLGVIAFLSSTIPRPLHSVSSTTRKLQESDRDLQFTSKLEEDVDWRYGIMMDMGSSGSRIFIYRWQVAFPLRSIIELGKETSNPGVSFYVGTSSDTKEIKARVSTSLLPLLSFAKNLVPPAEHKNTPIHAKCTAGCRLLSNEGVKWTIEGVRHALSGSGFKFKDEWAEPIPGEMEAILDWISINSALGLLHQPILGANSIQISPTIGVMDVGGASAQIAYSVSPVMVPNAVSRQIIQGNLRDPNNPVVFSYGRGVFHLRLVNGAEHTIYAVSRLHYGLSDSLNVLLDYDVENKVAVKDNFTNVHYPESKWYPIAQKMKQKKQIVSHPCVQRGIFLTTSHGTIVRGGGDAKRCHELVKNFYIQAEKHDLGNMAWAFPQPPFKRSYMPFAAMNNFYRLSRLANSVLEDAHHHSKHSKDNKKGHKDHKEDKHKEESKFTVDSLRRCMDDYKSTTPSLFVEAAQPLCLLKWDELQLRYGSILSTDRLEFSCFGLIFMEVLLTEVWSIASKQQFHAMDATFRCPNIELPDVDKQFPGMNTTIQSNLHAIYDSSWALGGMVLNMESAEEEGAEDDR